MLAATKEHLSLYLEIANLANKDKAQLSEMAKTYLDSDDSIAKELVEITEGIYEERQVLVQVAQRKKDNAESKRIGHIRGDGGAGSVFEYMNTYKVISNELYAHLFRYKGTMYLLFPYAGTYGTPSIEVDTPSIKVDLDDYVLAAGAGGGGAAEIRQLKSQLPTLNLNPIVPLPVARATDIAMRELYSQLILQHPNMDHIVPCGFSLGAFLATQFTYFWSLSGQTVQCSAIAMAPVPIAPIYTGEPEDLDVSAFALVIQREEKNIIDPFMLSDYSGACTPPANLQALTYTPATGAVDFNGTIDLTKSVQHYKTVTRITQMLPNTKKSLAAAQEVVNEPLPPELDEMSDYALRQSLIDDKQFTACLDDMSTESDMKLLKYAFAKNKLWGHGVPDDRTVLDVVRELKSQADALRQNIMNILDDMATLDTGDLDAEPPPVYMEKQTHHDMRSLAKAYTELTMYTLHQKARENLPGGYVAARKMLDVHKLLTYIDMAKYALAPPHISLPKPKGYDELQLKF